MIVCCFKMMTYRERAMLHNEAKSGRGECESERVRKTNE